MIDTISFSDRVLEEKIGKRNEKLCKSKMLNYESSTFTNNYLIVNNRNVSISLNFQSIFLPSSDLRMIHVLEVRIGTALAILKESAPIEVAPILEHVLRYILTFMNINFNDYLALNIIIFLLTKYLLIKFYLFQGFGVCCTCKYIHLR